MWRRERALGWMLVPAPLILSRVHGHRRVATSGAGCCRYSRSCACSRRCSRCSSPTCSCVWRLMPIGARSTGEDGAAGAGGRTPLRAGLTALLVVALLAQGLVYGIHSGLVLSRADTRNLTREWMLAHIPAAPDRRRAGRARGTGRAQGPGAGRRITPTAGSCIRRCSGGSPRAARSRRASSNGSRPRGLRDARCPRR